MLLRGPLLDVFNVLGKVPCLGFRGMGSKLRGSQQKLLGILSDCVGVVRIDIRWLVILRLGLGSSGFRALRGVGEPVAFHRQMFKDLELRVLKWFWYIGSAQDPKIKPSTEWTSSR